MSGDENVARWIADKLKNDKSIINISLIEHGFVKLTGESRISFIAAALGVDNIVTRDDVTPLFNVRGVQPQFVVNVPSKAIWSGGAIEYIHSASAAFGTFGDLAKASQTDDVASYRRKDYAFYERAFDQHTAVSGITRVYDRVFQLHRHRGLQDITIALVDAYDMSAEDIRKTRALYGKFDVALKTTSYGSITSAASHASASMGAEALMFKELMGRLNKR